MFRPLPRYCGSFWSPMAAILKFQYLRYCSCVAWQPDFVQILGSDTERTERVQAQARLAQHHQRTEMKIIGLSVTNFVNTCQLVLVEMVLSLPLPYSARHVTLTTLPTMQICPPWFHSYSFIYLFQFDTTYQQKLLFTRRIFNQLS